MAEAAVNLEQVSFTYPGAAAPALEQVTLRVEAGERLGILGPNGGGKSTLLKLILGLLEGASGVITVCGMTPRAARLTGLIGYVPQRSEAELGAPVSAREAVLLAATWRLPPWKRVPRRVVEHADRLLGLVGASAFADKPIGTLSGGQMQRVLIARALVCGAKILALDEPTVGIDAAGQRTFADLLANVHRELGVTILTVTHDLRAVAASSDRVACLAKRLHSHMSPQGLTPQVLAELFSHDVAGLRGALGGVHIHAHGAQEPCPEAAHGDHGCGHDHGHHEHKHGDTKTGGGRADS